MKMKIESISSEDDDVVHNFHTRTFSRHFILKSSCIESRINTRSLTHVKQKITMYIKNSSKVYNFQCFFLSLHLILPFLPYTSCTRHVQELLSFRKLRKESSNSSGDVKQRRRLPDIKVDLIKSASSVTTRTFVNDQVFVETEFLPAQTSPMSTLAKSPASASASSTTTSPTTRVNVAQLKSELTSHHLYFHTVVFTLVFHSLSDSCNVCSLLAAL